jgi:hypothetical protein
MDFVRVLPLIISSLLIGAHFLRGGNILVTIVCLAAPLLLLIRKPAVRIVLQIMLVIAAIEWLRTAFVIAQERSAYGAPVTRMFVILGSVALFTLLSALPLRRGRRVGEPAPHGEPAHSTPRNV